ncbi:phosphonate ABC transporter, permease protein PhnE [Microbacterium sp. UBA3394]|uniref:phosphonate ABC transporter, permease protein PhnE n=1 Tax=Microbacterium sp. UBA3394 TaxID=1946945 RepID=UPI000C35F04D|nr:phosphonate ABC transporter, permease protein PhnE [Microbacterium sp. UBA3394]MAB20626.1 phosphonate ABC transporter, permease protein PhnE [Microbacterium sp.]MAM54931.1 phosphonate ABC transporter, permease protein PhnE [Microbacterium sp.]|tara:strand:- start:904 stop:1707 length:804 start_codon:yes stop_codon:yes gene_type:complete
MSGAHLRVPPKPTQRLRVALIALAFTAFTVATCLPAIGGVELDFGAIVQNWRNGADKVGQLLQPDFSFVPRTIQPVLETVQMAIVGAAAAVVVSVPLTLWAARPTNPNGFTRRLVRAVINVVRAVPDLVYATILVAMVGVGALPGLLTLFLFDIGIVVKLVSEAIDSADHPYMEAGRAAGGTQSQINRVTALPQSWPLFANQWLYALELNVRISAILGIVGAGGVGRLLDERRAFFAYDDVAIIILEILVVVIAIEWFSNFLRRRLV